MVVQNDLFNAFVRVNKKGVVKRGANGVLPTTKHFFGKSGAFITANGQKTTSFALPMNPQANIWYKSTGSNHAIRFDPANNRVLATDFKTHALALTMGADGSLSLGVKVPKLKGQPPIIVRLSPSDVSKLGDQAVSHFQSINPLARVLPAHAQTAVQQLHQLFNGQSASLQSSVRTAKDVLLQKCYTMTMTIYDSHGNLVGAPTYATVCTSFLETTNGGGNSGATGNAGSASGGGGGGGGGLNLSPTDMKCILNAVGVALAGYGVSQAVTETLTVDLAEGLLAAALGALFAALLGAVAVTILLALLVAAISSAYDACSRVTTGNEIQ
jgi:hypothetical protein